MTHETFDDVVAGFYLAAAGEIGWTDALMPFQRAVSAIGVHLHGIDLAQGSISFSHVATDLPAEAEFDYIRTYHRIDPRAQLVMTLKPGEWMNCWEHFDAAFVAADPFYQQFLIPYGGRYVSGVKLIQEEALSVVLGVHRGPGSEPFTSDELLICRRLARHLGEALRLHQGQLQQRNQGRLGVELLSRLRPPVALVDADRRVLGCNAAAQALLARHAAVIESDGCIRGRRQADDSALLVALVQVTRGPGEGAAGPAADQLFLRLQAPAGDNALGIYFIALRPQSTLGFFGKKTLAMLLFHEPGSQVELDPFVVGAAFQLTPAEARVAVAAVRGHSPADIARRQGVSIHTVRSQLGTIFRKTGTTRQAELVGLLASLPVAMLDLAAGVAQQLL